MVKGMLPNITVKQKFPGSIRMEKPGNLYGNRKKPARFAAIMAMRILSGCAAVGPDYVPPEIHVSETWHTSMKGDCKLRHPIWKPWAVGGRFSMIPF